MMVSDQRKDDNGRDGRKSIFLQYSGYFILIITICFALAGSLTWTWYRSHVAYAMSTENCKKIDNLDGTINKIPVIEEQVRQISKSFEDFRTEQRIFNRELLYEVKQIISE